MHVSVISPEASQFDGEATSLIAPAFDGEVGILPRHAPMMTAISSTGTVDITELDGRTESMFVSDGFAQVQHNVLTLVCEAGELAAERLLQSGLAPSLKP